MKKSLLLLLLLTGITNAQIVSIPDANFKTKLLSAASNNQVAINLSGNYFKIDANNDGEIQLAEALAVKELFVDSSNISSLIGIASFSNLTFLKCSFNQIASLNINQNLNLKKLYCGNNNLASINVMPNTNLEELKIEFNHLTTLDVSLNINLKVLSCYYNPLGEIDVTNNANLEVLTCSNNGLTSLDVSQNLNLTSLYCYSNSLSGLDVTQNVNLRSLWCYSNPLYTLDVSQNANLHTLFCKSNNLSALDISQNGQMRDLICESNQLTSINTSQNPLLDRLKINNNLLTTIDVSNNLSLRYLYFNNNQITTLNVNQHHSLLELNCANNQMATLYVKNGQNEILTIAQNPDLVYICADESQIASVQAAANANTTVSSFCSFTPGEEYNTVSGVVIFDYDNDGCSPTDPLIPGSIRLDLTNAEVTSGVYPNTDGSYLLYAAAGDYQLTTQLENPDWFSVTPITTDYNFPAQNGSNQNQDFCVTATESHNDLEIVIATPINEPPRPGFDATYLLIYRNKGTQILSGNIVMTYQDSVIDFLSASRVPNSQSYGILNWNFTNLFPFETNYIFVTFNINSPTETPAVNIGDQLEYTATINPIANDETPADNYFYLKQTVEGAYDPNDKTCLEGDTVSPTRIGDFLHYQIRFENTGTANASFVKITDVIDPAQFDINSLQVMYASHPMTTRITGNTIEFMFADINLPFDDANNDGALVFKIKTRNTLVTGDTVANKANIYFDYNFSIETNTAYTTFQETLDGHTVADNSIKIHQNPTKDNISVKSDLAITSIELYDVQGRILIAKLINETHSTLDVSSYANGVYFLKVISGNAEKTMKIVKE